MDRKIPRNIDHKISMVNASRDNSCPPLKPMANNKYNDINLDELGGISKSLLMYTATIPNTKNKRAGLLKFSINNPQFMIPFPPRYQLSVVEFPANKK